MDAAHLILSHLSSPSSCTLLPQILLFAGALRHPLFPPKDFIRCTTAELLLLGFTGGREKLLLILLFDGTASKVVPDVLQQ